jgi:hypothetical protein
VDKFCPNSLLNSFTMQCAFAITANRYFYNFQVDWGDDTPPDQHNEITFTAANTWIITHTYATLGQKSINITWLNYDFTMGCNDGNAVTMIYPTIESRTFIYL